jgi:hypothetical protein
MSKDDDFQERRPPPKPPAGKGPPDAGAGQPPRPAAPAGPRDEGEDEPAPPRRKKGGVVSSVIPYRNVPALIGYYCAIFGLLPGLGCLLAPVALVLGIFGMVIAFRNPDSKGMGHSVLSLVFALVVAPLVWVGLIVLAVYLIGVEESKTFLRLD